MNDRYDIVTKTPDFTLNTQILKYKISSWREHLQRMHPIGILKAALNYNPTWNLSMNRPMKRWHEQF